MTTINEVQDEKIAALEEKFAGLESKVSELSGDLEKANALAADYETKFDDLHGRLAAVEKTVEGLSATILDDGAKVDTFYSEIAALPDMETTFDIAGQSPDDWTDAQVRLKLMNVEIRVSDLCRRAGI